MQDSNNKLEPAIEAVARASGADNATIQRLLRAVRGEETKRGETFLKTGEVGQKLDWHRKTVLRHAKELGAVYRSKRCVRFPLSAVERFMAQGV